MNWNKRREEIKKGWDYWATAENFTIQFFIDKLIIEEQAMFKRLEEQNKQMFEALENFQKYDTPEFLQYVQNEGVDLFEEFRDKKRKENGETFSIFIIGLYKTWKKIKIYNPIIESITGKKIGEELDEC